MGCWVDQTDGTDPTALVGVGAAAVASPVCGVERGDMFTSVTPASVDHSVTVVWSERVRVASLSSTTVVVR